MPKIYPSSENRRDILEAAQMIKMSIVECFAAWPVFHALQNMNLSRKILFAPSAKDCERYLTGTDAIVVRQLIGQSPLIEVDGNTVPRIEKILVDAIGDNELLFAGGSEIYNIYKYARERNNVNMSKLMRYASRRNRKEKVEQIINTIDHDKPKEQVH